MVRGASGEEGVGLTAEGAEVGKAVLGVSMFITDIIAKNRGRGKGISQQAISKYILTDPKIHGMLKRLVLPAES
jgi:hypothetical protein